MLEAVSPIAFLLALVMAGVHFLAEELEESISGYQEQLVSFATGVSITYIFVQLVPEFHRIALESSGLIFLSPLLGFSSIHLVEKYIAKNGRSRAEISREYGEVHSVFLFLYHGAIGFLIASLLAESVISGLLFFVPVMLHIGVSSFSLSELHEDVAQRLSVKLVVSITPVLGVLVYSAGMVSSSLFHPVFGLVIGMFMYVVIRDSIPRDDNGQPVEYVLGVLIYLAVILAASLI